MAEIITPERASRLDGPGLSYWLSTKIFNQPLAMEASLAARLHGAIRDKSFDAQISLGPLGSKFAGQAAAARAGYRMTDDGVAIVPVQGVLIDRGEWLGDRGGWMTSYEGLSEQFRRIAKDDAVKAVLLDIDSGGGVAAGLMDLCAEIAKLGKKKPITALAANEAFSAAYAIGCAASEFYVTKFGGAGSIGVVVMHMSYADMMASSGMEPTIIHAGAHKANGNPYQPLSHLARGEMSALCDQAYGDFTAHVAARRPLDEAGVRATEARCYHGDRAVAAKLADGVKSFDEVMARIRRSLGGVTKATEPKSSKKGARAVSQDADVAATRPDYDTIIAAIIAGMGVKAQTPVAAPPAALAPAPAAASPAPAPAAEARARIKSIIDCAAAKDRPGLARHLALETELDAASAEKILAAALSEKAAAGAELGDALARQMSQAGNAAGVKPEAAKPAGQPSLADKMKARAAARVKDRV